MMPTAPMVDLSCLLPIMKRSNTMVHSSVKRRRAMNIGTFRPAVPVASSLLEGLARDSYLPPNTALLASLI